MQILKFEFSDLSDCSAEKNSMILTKNCNMIHCKIILCLTQQKKITYNLAEKNHIFLKKKFAFLLVSEHLSAKVCITIEYVFNI